jgi:hypothetical protein
LPRRLQMPLAHAPAQQSSGPVHSPPAGVHYGRWCAET